MGRGLMLHPPHPSSRAREAGPCPYRLHGAPCKDHRPAFLYHLGKVHGWIQEQEFEAALTEAA